MVKPWKKAGSRLLASYAIFDVRQDALVSPRSGETLDFHVIDTADWVNVVALTDEQEVVFIRQFRAGTGEIALEIPGGIIDPGETPEIAAPRELREETGYAVGTLIPLGSIEPNPAIQTNRCYTFLAEGCTLVGAPDLDDREDIDIELIPLARVPELLGSGAISHALVAVAFQKLELRRQGRLSSVAATEQDEDT